MIRRNLQAGSYRKVASLLAAIGGFVLIAWNWQTLTNEKIDVLSGMQKVAFVAGAFSVTAYNLRVRVIDLILKINMSPTATANLAIIARSCGRKLTNLVLLFTVSAVLMAGCGFIPSTAQFAWAIASLATSSFAVSIVQFIYVIFAFERLERFVLDDAEAQSKSRESDRLLAEKRGEPVD